MQSAKEGEQKLFHCACEFLCKKGRKQDGTSHSGMKIEPAFCAQFYLLLITITHLKKNLGKNPALEALKDLERD